LKFATGFAIQAPEQLSPVVNKMNRKPAAVVPRTWHSLWDEMFSAVAELDPNNGIGAENETFDAAGQVAGPNSEQLEALVLLAQVCNDNGRRR
jgi:hypothetical protein